MDLLNQFKENQKQSWASFIPFEIVTTHPAANLVRFADIRAGDRVLDVGCGTGVVAITAAHRGALVTGLDLTPELLAGHEKMEPPQWPRLRGKKATWNRCRSTMAPSMSS